MPWALREGKRLVVVAGEANAWPYRPPSHHPDELVQWMAVRVDTGERFDVIVKPRNPLAPSTPGHTHLDRDALLGGLDIADALARWRAFVHDDDIIVGWGHYAASLMREAGGYLPDGYLDLRGAATQWIRRKPGSVEEFAGTLELTPEPMARGRGGLRLGMAHAITRTLVAGMQALT